MVIAKWIAGSGFALAAATAASAAAPTFPANAQGDWRGSVQASDAPKHLFVHIHKTRDGGYVATLYSPERRAGDMVARPIDAPDGVLAFTADGGQFRGEWSEANGRWEGTWTEAGTSAPLVLSLNDDSTAVRLERMQGLQDTLIAPNPGAANPNIKDVPAGAGRPAIPPDIVPPSAR